MGKITGNPMASDEEEDGFASAYRNALARNRMADLAQLLSGRLRQLDKRCRATNAENDRLKAVNRLLQVQVDDARADRMSERVSGSPNP